MPGLLFSLSCMRIPYARTLLLVMYSLIHITSVRRSAVDADTPTVDSFWIFFLHLNSRYSTLSASDQTGFHIEELTCGSYQHSSSFFFGLSRIRIKLFRATAFRPVFSAAFLMYLQKLSFPSNHNPRYFRIVRVKSLHDG